MNVTLTEQYIGGHAQVEDQYIVLKDACATRRSVSSMGEK